MFPGFRGFRPFVLAQWFFLCSICEAMKSNNDVSENIRGYVVRLLLPRNSLAVAGGAGVGQVAGKFVCFGNGPQIFLAITCFQLTLSPFENRGRTSKV